MLIGDKHVVWVGSGSATCSGQKVEYGAIKTSPLPWTPACF